MIVEQDRVAIAKEQFKKEKEFCANVIKKAEVYERLSFNKDYLEHLQDVKDAISAHEKNINGYIAQLSEVPGDEHPALFRLRIAELVAHHQAQKSTCYDFLTMVERTKASKEQAMKRLDEIKEIEKEIGHD